MFRSAQKLSLLFAVTTAFLFLSMFAFSTNAFAENRTCCQTGSGPCHECDTSGRYWKNDPGGVVCQEGSTVSPWGCRAANSIPSAGIGVGDYVCTGVYKVGNACGGSSGGPFTCTVRPNPSTMNLSVGATKRLSSTLATAPKAFLSWWASNVTYTSKDTSKATVSTWATYATAYATNITGAGIGSTTIAVRGNVDPTKSDPLPAVSCNGIVNVNVTAPLACIPGASCRPATGTAPTYGGSMICSMPAISKPAEYSSYTLSYGLRCDVYNGTTLVKKNAINTTSTSQNFAQFKLSYRGTYRCSFQHCFENTTNKYCSAWGSI